MATSESEGVSIEEFRLLTERADLQLSPEELVELKPLYELHLMHIQTLRSIDFKAEEIGLAFHPDWPPA